MREKVSPFAIFLVAAPALIVAALVGAAINLPWLIYVPVVGALLWAVIDWYLLPMFDKSSSQKDDDA